MPQTQPKPGHHRTVSTNPTKKTGRSDGHEQVQPKPGHLPGKSSNPTGTGGSLPGGQNVRGYAKNERGTQSTKRANVSKDGRNRTRKIDAGY